MTNILSLVANCLDVWGVGVEKQNNRLTFEARSDNRKKFELCAEHRPNNDALLFTRYMGPLEEIEKLSEQHKMMVHQYLKTLLDRSDDGIYYSRDPVTGDIFVETKLYSQHANFCKHFFHACAGVANLREFVEDDLRRFIDAPA